MSETKPSQKYDSEKIERMRAFYDDGHSLAEVAAEFGGTTSSVASVFRRRNVKTRRYTVSSKSIKASHERRADVDETTLRLLYTERRMSIIDVAKEMDLGSDIIYRNLQRYRIPIRPPAKLIESPLTSELLRRLYLEEGLTAAGIAVRLGYSPHTISNKLRRFGIKKYRSAISAGPTDGISTEIDGSDAAVAGATDMSGEVFSVAELAEMYNLHKDTVGKLVRRGIFPHAFRKDSGRRAVWLIPSEDLLNFTPRRKGGLRADGAPKTVPLHSRGKYARLRIKQLYGYGRTEIGEMILMEKGGVPRQEIAARFRLAERFVIDILDAYAVCRTRRRENLPVVKDWRKISEKLLRDLYVIGKFSITYILDKLHTNRTTLYIGLMRYEMPLREEPLPLSARENQEIFRHLYIRESLSPEVISERLNLTHSYVKNKLKAIDALIPSAD